MAEGVLGSAAPRAAGGGLTTEHDALQAQYDGIPVPCYTWRREDDDFVLERANRAAFELAGGELERHLGKRLAEVYPDRADLAEDFATAFATKAPVRREMEHTLVT